MKELTLVLLE